MSKTTVTFKQCVQNKQELNTGNDYMISRIYLTVYLSGKHLDSHIDVKQIAGGILNQIL